MAKKTFLDSISSPLPCSKDWNEMIGGDEKRFCTGCQKDVYNLSALSRNRARKLVAENSGRICVRYVRLPNGRIETPTTRLHQIVRPASIAAGMLGATLAISSNISSQSVENDRRDIQGKDLTQSEKTKKSYQVEFIIVDTQNIPIPDTHVQLIHEKSKKEFTSSTNEFGIARFGLPTNGRYSVRAKASHFMPYQRLINVTQHIEPTIEVSLEIGTFIGIVAVNWYEIPLFDYIAQHKDDVVKKYIETGFDIKTKDVNGVTALHVAVEHGNIEMVRYLLDRGSEVNGRTKTKRTPLLMLDDFDDDDSQFIEIIRLLVARGADVNAQDSEKLTTLMNAADNENIEAVKVLLAAGADPNFKDSDGETAMDKTDTEEIKQLLKSSRKKR